MPSAEFGKIAFSEVDAIDSHFPAPDSRWHVGFRIAHVARRLISHNPIASTTADPPRPTIVPIRASFTRSISSYESDRPDPNRGSVSQKNNAPSNPGRDSE